MEIWWRCLLLLVLSANARAWFFSNPFKETHFDSWMEEELRRNQSREGFPKYFHEAGKGAIPNHYDGRFQHGVVGYDVKQDVQIQMIRAYLEFFREHSLETWLAHGTLLGWWWNAKRLPWDGDIDMQVSDHTLFYLAEHFNNTVYEYSPERSDPSAEPPVKRSFLLDINPAYIERSHGNGNNVIDARWIDMRNGLYIDITAVSETEPATSPGVWMCKNRHKYKTTDLFPMRETMFEGVVAKVPYAYVRILTEEYQEKALIVTEFEGHKWDPESREWIKKTLEEIRKDRHTLHDERRKKVLDKISKQKAKEAARKKAKFGASGEKEKEGSNNHAVG